MIGNIDHDIRGETPGPADPAHGGEVAPQGVGGGKIGLKYGTFLQT